MKPIPSQRDVIALTALLLTLGLGSGCSSTPSNTQRGAAGGAALGALAGAIIGNNRGSGNAASGAAIGAAAGAIAGGAIGHNQDRRAASSNGYPDAATTNIYVEGQPPLPPAPIAESTSPQPGSNTVWIPGYWSYENGNRYVWMAGHWEVPPPGATAFQPPEWRRQGNGYVYVRAYWR
jgi:hypothetical protein